MNLLNYILYPWAIYKLWIFKVYKCRFPKRDEIHYFPDLDKPYYHGSMVDQLWIEGAGKSIEEMEASFERHGNRCCDWWCGTGEFEDIDYKIATYPENPDVNKKIYDRL